VGRKRYHTGELERTGVEMILLDTNILIEILKGHQETINKVQGFDMTLAISSITAMELYYGAHNKAELNRLEKFVSLFHTIHINETISAQATKLVKIYAKSHNLDIPDSLIASTALMHQCELFTYNIKDFTYIKHLTLA
jgi:predicted nucleic acid-binding protein